MMRRFVRFFSGNMSYREPTGGVRGSDWTTRATPDVLHFGTGEINGAGTAYGQSFSREHPYALNTVQQLVTQDVEGRAVSSRSGAMAGHLLDPAFLAKKLGLG